MPLLEGVSLEEAPNLLGYGNVACVVKDGTADDRKSPLVHPSGFFISGRQRSRRNGLDLPVEPHAPIHFHPTDTLTFEVKMPSERFALKHSW